MTILGNTYCHIDILVQERRNTSALAMELRLSWTNPSKYLLTYKNMSIYVNILYLTELYFVIMKIDWQNIDDI